MLRKMYREFAENEVKPLAEEIDEEERFPMETVEKMAKLGMMGISSRTAVVCWPEASVPAPGSVRPKAPIFLPLSRSGRYFPLPAI